MIRRYRELKKLKTFEERYEYLKLGCNVGDRTFGFDRYLNQMLYRSSRWKTTRDKIIIRDKGCDLGIIGRDIHSMIIVHHMNPMTIDDVLNDKDIVYEEEFLISTTMDTHNAIHYGNKDNLLKMPKERSRNDTCPWK